MTKNKEMKKLSIIFVFALIVGLLGMGNVAQAAHDAVYFSVDTTLPIETLGINLTILAGGEVAAFTTGASSISFDLESGSSLVVKSTDRRTLTNSLVTTNCTDDYSSVTLTSTSTQTVTVTPTAANCTKTTGQVGGSSGSGSSAAATTTTTTTTTTTPTTTTTATTPTTTTPTTTTTAPAAVPTAPVTIPTLSATPTTAEISATLSAIVSQVAYISANKTASNALTLLADVVTKLTAVQKAVRGESATVSSDAIPSSGSFKKSLKIGLKDNDVMALQKFLKLQGASIYPEGLATGYFGKATEKAIQKFQEKYGIAASGDAGYGIVGPMTRAKINSLLGL
jgi:hypothetical protein